MGPLSNFDGPLNSVLWTTVGTINVFLTDKVNDSVVFVWFWCNEAHDAFDTVILKTVLYFKVKCNNSVEIL